MRQPDHPRGPSAVAPGGRAVPAAGLLPGLERCGGRDRDRRGACRRPACAAGARPRMVAVSSGPVPHARRQPGPGHRSRRSRPRAMAMAGITLDDVDVVELYDCYTFTVLVTLEDYGFCEKGEGGPFVSSGMLGPGGKLKLQYRRRSAVGLLHVGHDSVVRGSHPGARPGRRAPGQSRAGGPGQRQRRRLRPPRHHRPRRGGAVMKPRWAPCAGTATPRDFLDAAARGEFLFVDAANARTSAGHRKRRVRHAARPRPSGCPPPAGPRS